MMSEEEYLDMLLAARASREREWDQQALVALLINSPHLPSYSDKLETRQLLWPFQPAGQQTGWQANN
jgi:hypothetical protein